MNYSDIKEFDVANGPGVRLSLFVSGCSHHCKNCFNKETWKYDYGEPFDDLVLEKFISLYEKSKDIYDGISFLGGEPLDPSNMNCVLNIILKIKEKYPDINIWIYSGYIWETLIERGEPIRQILENTDVLVDGRFVETLKDLRLKFRGSSNQRIINVKKSLKNNSIFLLNI